MYALERMKFLPRMVRSNTPLPQLGNYGGNIFGGMLLGTGMALSGACPGTTLVQLAQGVPPAPYTILGALTGAAAHACSQSWSGNNSEGPSAVSKRTTIPEAVGISDTVAYMMIAAVVTAILRLTNVIDGDHITTPIVGGLLLGAAQAASLLLTHRPIGVSASYEQAGKYLLHALGVRGFEKPAWPPRTIVFSLGIFAGGLAMANSTLASGSSGVFEVPIPVWQAWIGGFALVFGARTADGCTSGHGLSGLAALSLSSLFTVASAFSAGIGATFVMETMRNMG